MHFPRAGLANHTMYLVPQYPSHVILALGFALDLNMDMAVNLDLHMAGAFGHAGQHALTGGTVAVRCGAVQYGTVRDSTVEG